MLQGVDIGILRENLLWAGFLLLSMLLFAAVPSCIRTGARHSDPSMGAGIFAFFMTLFCSGAAYYAGVLPRLLLLDRQAMINLALCGLVTAFFWLCLFTALTGGLVSKVFPVERLSYLAVLILSHFLFGEALGLWRLCAMVLMLLGTVLILSRGKRNTSRLWLVYAAAAAVSSAGLALMKTLLLPADLDVMLYHVCRSAVAFIVLLFFALIRGKQKTIPAMGAKAWIALGAGGLLFALSLIADSIRGRIGDFPLLHPLRILGYGFMILAARIYTKERLPGSCLFGTLLCMAGMFVIEIGW